MCDEISSKDFLERSKDYLIALEALTKHLRTELLNSIGLIASHSIELALKAFLIEKGFEEKELRRIGHNLEDAWNKSTGKGLKLEIENKYSVDILNIYHDKPHLYRYPKKGVGSATTETKRLLFDVKSIIEAVEAQINV